MIWREGVQDRSTDMFCHSELLVEPSTKACCHATRESKRVTGLRLRPRQAALRQGGAQGQVVLTE